MEVGVGGEVQVGALFGWRCVEGTLLLHAVVVAAPSPLGMFDNLTQPLTDAVFLGWRLALETKDDTSCSFRVFWCGPVLSTPYIIMERIMPWIWFSILAYQERVFIT